MSDRTVIDDPLVARLADLREIAPPPATADRVWALASREWLGARSRAHRPVALRFAPAVVAAALLFVLGGSAQVLAATPESPLYGARVALEQVAAAVLPEDVRADRLASLVRERQAEVARLEVSGSAAAAVAVAARDAAVRAYTAIVPQETPRTAAPLPVVAPARPDVTVAPVAPRANETLVSGRFVAGGTPVAGACVSLGSVRCAGTTDSAGGFALSVAAAAGSEPSLLFYAPSGELLASLRFTSTGAAVQVLGEIDATPPAVPSPALPSSAPTSVPTFAPVPTPIVTFPAFSAPPLPSPPAFTLPPIAPPVLAATPAPVTITVSGTVRYRSGAPAARACVVVPAQSECAVLTAEDGSFRVRITALAGSPIALYAYVRSESTFALGSALVSAGGDQQVTIVLDR